MFDLFGNNRNRSISDFLKELNEMYGTNFYNMGDFGMNEKTTTGKDKLGDWKKTTFTSEDGSMKFTSYVRTYGDTMSPKDSSDVRTLKEEMEVAIEEQNFEKAAELRDKIKKLEENEEKISNLQSELDKAVKEQKFEEAIKLRDKINKLKG